MMPDLEKTIKCLEYCTGDSNYCGGHDCPYWDFDDSEVSCRTQMELDALALLKEQEATKPTRVNTNYEQHWNCGNCNAVISGLDKFCHECGRPVLWKGR